MRLIVSFFLFLSMALLPNFSVADNSSKSSDITENGKTSSTKNQQSSFEINDGSMVKNVKVIKGELNVPDFSIQSIVLEQTKLSDVIAKHHGYLNKFGEAGGFSAISCYIVKNNGVVVFQSSEMGGPDHVINRMSFYKSQKQYEKSKFCTKSKEWENLEGFNGGIGLNSSEQELIKKTWYT